MTDLRVGKAISYAALPGIWPRVSSLFFSGFGTLAYFIALTYSMVRLLPGNHPYLDSRNIGTYGIRHVIAAALHELKFQWKHIDQILVFFALLAGIAGMLMFGLGLAAFLIVSPVFAMDMIITQYPQTDVAFNMLDRVFGLSGIFNSNVSTGMYGPYPNFFHVGLQGLFQFYSMGLFLLSVFIFLYHIVVIVAETSLTGTPFGHRFDNVWVPLRIIAALGLLMPAFGGLNAAQYIVLYSAKWGSGLGTYGWVGYNLRSGDNPLALPNEQMIARPAMPDYTNLIKDLLVMRGCMEMFVHSSREFFGPSEYLVNGEDFMSLLPIPFGPGNVPPRTPLVQVTVGGAPFVPTYEGYAGTFTPALNFYDGGDIRIVLGTHDADRFKDYDGQVMPFCGEIIIPVTGQTPEALYVAEGYMAAVVRVLYGIRRNGATGPVNAMEYSMPIATARDFFQTSTGWANYTRLFTPPRANMQCFWDTDNDWIDEIPDAYGLMPLSMLRDCRGPVPTDVWLEVLNRYQKAFEWGALAGYDYLTGAITAEDMDYSIGDVSYTSLGHTNPLLMDLNVLRYGWGGAGLWFNKIAERNGSLISAIGAAPFVSKYPYYMEKIREQRLKNDAKVEGTGCEPYNPAKAQGFAITNVNENDQFPTESALALYKLCTNIKSNEGIVLKADDGTGTLVPITRSTLQPNPVLNILNALFGASSFFNILDNPQVHPMAMLSSLGRTLIDKAIFNMAAATGTSIVGGLSQLAGGVDEPGFAYATVALNQLSSAFVSFGVIALTAGVMLYYVVPILPFMYFFFAVGRWVKTIFEAMVGVPLWALAHLSFKGPGLPGTAASSGYFLILEIFIRPILTVFSLIVAFAVFSAAIAVLNAIFNIAVTNIFGADVKAMGATANPTVRGIVDQFFLTIVYVIIVYLTGTSAFKLIDLVPDSIMRWSGAGVRSWGGSDNADELVDSTSQYVAMPTSVIFGKIGEGITGLSRPSAETRQAIQIAESGGKKLSPAEQEIARQKQAMQQGTSPSAPLGGGLDAPATPKSPSSPSSPLSGTSGSSATPGNPGGPAAAALAGGRAATVPGPGGVRIDPATGKIVDPLTGKPLEQGAAPKGQGAPMSGGTKPTGGGGTGGTGGGKPTKGGN